MAFRLLNCLARAVAKHGVKFVCNLVAPGSDVVFEIARDTYQSYCQTPQRKDNLRAEVQALAQASADQVRREVAAAVGKEAANLPGATQQKIAAYLNQMPAMIRRSLRRPSDPTGTTVPGDLRLKDAEDLLPFLPARPPRFRPGDRPLPGVDWVLEEPLGVGGFGEVWKARHAHMRSKPPVALKFCLDDSAVPVLRNGAGLLDRLMRHGRHPGIVPLLNTYLSADPPCLEYEYVEGGDLAALIRELHGRGQVKPLGATQLLLRLAEIVAFAHQASPPIVHGDLKPANILVRRGEGGKIALRVTDFDIGGLATARAARETTQPTQSRQQLLTEAVRGAYTPLYASPEQMCRKRGEPADPRDDVHALGVIWFQMLTDNLGMLSIPSDWRQQVEACGLGEGLVELLARCIAPRAENRPASAAVLAEELKTALRRQESRRPGRVLGTICLVVAVAALLAVGAWAVFTGPDRMPEAKTTNLGRKKGGEKRPAPKPELRLLPVAPVTVPEGGTVAIKVSVQRQGCAGPVQFNVEGLPANVQAAPVTIAADQDAADVRLHAAEGAEDGPVSARLVAVLKTVRAEQVFKVAVDRRLRKAAASNERGVRALVNRGLAWSGKGKFDQAIKDFTEAIRLDLSKDATIYRVRAKTYIKMKQYDQAIKDLTESIRLDPKDVRAYRERANVYIIMDQYDQAIKDFTEAIRLKPDYALAYLLRANTYTAMKQYDRAIEDANEAIRLSPNDAYPFVYRGQAWSGKGKHDQAIKDFTEAIRLDPKNAWAHVNRGQAWNGKRKHDQAIKDFTEAIRLDPKDAWAFQQRANTYAAMKQYDRAIEDADEAIRLSPNDAYTYAYRGEAWSGKGKYDQAIKDYTEAIRLKSDIAWFYHWRGDAHRAMGNQAQAQADFDRAVQLNPTLDPSFGKR